MRYLLIVLTSLLVSACATVPSVPVEFQSGWLDRLPTRRIELVAFVYPTEGNPLLPPEHRDLRDPYGRFLAPIEQSDATRIEAAVNRHLGEALRARGFEVGSTLLALRSDHLWLWNPAKGPGSEPGPVPNFVGRSPTYLPRARAYLTTLRSQVSSHPESTVLFVCVEAHLGSRDGRWVYPVPVYMHYSSGGEFFHTERCGKIAAIVAVDDRLRLIAHSTFYTPSGAKINQESWNLFSGTTADARRLTPEEWGEEIAKAVLEKIRAIQ